MSNQIIGILMVVGSLAWMAFGDKLKSPALPTVPPEQSPPPQSDAAVIVQSRVEAVEHCEALMTYFESADNKTGADSIRTAISSIYAPKG
jgi:hypothetical protein